MSSPVLLSRLRQETRAQHEALDAFVGPELTRSLARYARFLAASLLAIDAIEPGIARRLGESFSPVRALCLRADLRALAVFVGAGEDVLSVASVALGTFPSAASSDLPATEAAAWGAAYVVEGSALGGTVLAARVRATLGNQAPARYLTMHGEATATHWRSFLARLEAFGARSSSADHDEAVAAASRTFDLYSRAFAASFAAPPT